jgi:hypothetical protein
MENMCIALKDISFAVQFCVEWRLFRRITEFSVAHNVRTAAQDTELEILLSDARLSPTVTRVDVSLCHGNGCIDEDVLMQRR